MDSTVTIERAARRRRPFEGFYLVFAILAFAVVLGGFFPRLPAYFAGERPWPPLIVHVHAVLFYGWMAFFTSQTVLVRTGRVRAHRTMGVFGAGLAALMVVVGVTMVLTMAVHHYERGVMRGLGFMPVPLTDMILFPSLVAAAIALRNDVEAHKRLMLLATVSLLGAAFGRMDLIDIPKGALPEPARAFVSLYILPLGVVVLAMAHDLLTRGRIHRAYLLGGLFIVVLYACASVVLTSPGWIPFAKGMLGLS
jgi:hypothetical protein